MQDYFRPFLLNKKTQSLGEGDPSTLKTHLMWALLLGGTAIVSWKASGWYSQYALLKEKFVRSK